MTPETLAAIGALLGALGAFIPHISSWLKDRSQYGLEHRKMDLAIKEIDFISKCGSQQVLILKVQKSKLKNL